MRFFPVVLFFLLLLASTVIAQENQDIAPEPPLPTDDPLPVDLEGTPEAATEEDIQAMIEAGANWLLGVQLADGGWPENIDDNTSAQGATAYAVLGLYAAYEHTGEASYKEAATKGADYLLARPASFLAPTPPHLPVEGIEPSGALALARATQVTGNPSYAQKASALLANMHQAFGEGETFIQNHAKEPPALDTRALTYSLFYLQAHQALEKAYADGALPEHARTLEGALLKALSEEPSLSALPQGFALDGRMVPSYSLAALPAAQPQQRALWTGRLLISQFSSGSWGHQAEDAGDAQRTFNVSWPFLTAEVLRGLMTQTTEEAFLGAMRAVDYLQGAQKESGAWQSIALQNNPRATGAVLFALVKRASDTSNRPPHAALALSTRKGQVPLDVLFDAEESTDEDGHITSYAWDFGDGTQETTTSSKVLHTYQTIGVFNATLTLTDSSGSHDRERALVNVLGANRAPISKFQATPEKGDAPLEVQFDATSSSDTDGKITEYQWLFGDGALGSGAKVVHTYKSGGTYHVALTVKDDRGARGRSAFDVHVTGEALPSDTPERADTQLLIFTLAVLGVLLLIFGIAYKRIIRYLGGT